MHLKTKRSGENRSRYMYVRPGYLNDSQVVEGGQVGILVDLGEDKAVELGVGQRVDEIRFEPLEAMVVPVEEVHQVVGRLVVEGLADQPAEAGALLRLAHLLPPTNLKQSHITGRQ